LPPFASAGAAVREPLQLPLPPLALSSAGLFVVAVCDDGVYAFDRNSSRQVQQIEYAHDDAYVGLSQRLPAAADAGGRCICLATSSQVLWLEPVALEQQVCAGIMLGFRALLLLLYLIEAAVKVLVDFR
jgi:hypothetical protein